jgi:hypothetical protein
VTGEGSPYDSISVKQVDDNTFTYEAKNSKTRYHANGRIVISGGGKTMTATASGVDADGNSMTLKLVYDKQYPQLCRGGRRSLTVPGVCTV